MSDKNAAVPADDGDKMEIEKTNDQETNGGGGYYKCDKCGKRLFCSGQMPPMILPTIPDDVQFEDGTFMGEHKKCCSDFSRLQWIDDAAGWICFLSKKP